MINFERRNYTAREVMELELKEYHENKKEFDFKVLEETNNYILIGYVNDDDLITLHVVEGRVNGERLNVNLYLNQNYKGKINTAQVSWYAIGSVFANEAKENAQQILDAANFAELISGKDYGKYFKKEND